MALSKEVTVPQRKHFGTHQAQAALLMRLTVLA